jgi:hypothetical protein
LQRRVLLLESKGILTDETALITHILPLPS